MLIIESNAHLDLKANAHIYLFIHSFIHSFIMNINVERLYNYGFLFNIR
jgi:hypothetical protein